MKIQINSDLRGWRDVDQATASRVVAHAAKRLNVTADEILARMAAGAKLIAEQDDYTTSYMRDAESARWTQTRPAAPAKIQCRKCRQSLPESRFTTLPEGRQTCDDCA